MSGNSENIASVKITTRDVVELPRIFMTRYTGKDITYIGRPYGNGDTGLSVNPCTAAKSSGCDCKSKNGRYSSFARVGTWTTRSINLTIKPNDKMYFI
jgi:hypothetical protein